MARYELVEGTSSKFWEVDVSGSDLTVTFGRIGTVGQSKTKSFADAAGAVKERDKLVKEKTGKGYTLVGTTTPSAATPSAVPQQVAKPTPVNKPVQAVEHKRIDVEAVGVHESKGPVASVHAPIATPVAAVDTAIVWPSGGFQWKNAWRQELPIVRGIHVPPVWPDLKLFSHLIALPDDAYGGHQRQLDTMAASAGCAWTYWGDRVSRERITREAIGARDAEYWPELLAQVYAGDRKDMRWALFHCVALHGLAFAMEAVFSVPELLQTSRYWREDDSDVLFVLRHAIASSDDAVHEEVFQLAQRLRQQDIRSEVACAHLFPHIPHWAIKCVEHKLADPQKLLLTCALPTQHFVAWIKDEHSLIQYARPALFLQIHLHGEAAFDMLAIVLKKSLASKDTAVRALELVTSMHVPQLLPLLVGELESNEVRTALDKLAAQYPAAAIKCAVEQAVVSRDRMVEGWTIRLALREHAALATALAALDGPVRTRFEAMLAPLQREEAAPEQLPALLREPPWLRSARQTDLPALAVAELPTIERIDWDPQELARANAYEASALSAKECGADGYPLSLGIAPAGVLRLQSGQLLQSGDVFPKQYSLATVDQVLQSPKSVQLALWNSYPPQFWSTWREHDRAVNALLARYGTAALPGFMAFAQSFPDRGLVLGIKVDSPQLVDIALHTLRNLKKTKDLALAWARAHPRTMLTKAMPQAFHAKHSAVRDNARFGLRWLVANGFETMAHEVAHSYGPAMEAALQALLSADPLLVLPGKMPKLPAFCVAASFRRPALPSGEALPVNAAEHIASMLAISKLEAPYPGLDIVRQTCTRASLAEFAWDIFEAWIAAGAPSKEAWAFTGLGLLGDDETARRLAPRIREWPGESAHARAVTGLDLLAGIGSDVALMHLNGIASKVKFKALQEHAKQKIELVAQARGFTAVELADRLVPDLGLDESGRLELNFGPRQFYVGFDEALKPFVKDAQGVRLKDLPKPIKSDDTALAEAATERYKQMKKDAKAIASLQVTRLEMAMVARRRWSATDFNLFFLEHPVMRHLATRVVWGVYDKGSLQHNFRVAEDWTLADADDNTYVLPTDATLGISHILEMSKSTQEAFGQIFADYEILQPFKQLGRETYALTPEEQQLDTLTRYASKVVATGSVMGLGNRGWDRGQAQDAGWVGEFTKRMDDDWQVELALDPGTVVGDMSYEPKQKLPSLTLRRRGSYDKEGLIVFGKLDPILASEVLRDIELLAPVKE